MSKNLRIALAVVLILIVGIFLFVYFGSNKFTVADPAKWFDSWGTEQSDSADKNGSGAQSGSQTGNGGSTQSGSQTGSGAQTGSQSGNGSGTQSGSQSGNGGSTQSGAQPGDEQSDTAKEPEPDPKPLFGLAFYDENGNTVLTFDTDNYNSHQKLKYPADVTDKCIFKSMKFYPGNYTTVGTFRLESIYLYTPDEEFSDVESPYLVPFNNVEFASGDTIDFGSNFTWDMAQDIWGERIWTSTGKQLLKDYSPSLAINIRYTDQNDETHSVTYHVAMDFSQIR